MRYQLWLVLLLVGLSYGLLYVLCRLDMRYQLWLVLLLVGLSNGLPHPQDEAEHEEADEEDAAEDEEEYDVYDAVGDAEEGKK
jgi:hypothetical protein